MVFGILRMGTWRRRAFASFGLVALAGSWTAVSSPAAQAATYNHNVVQVGAQSSDSSDHYATGVQAYLGHYPLPQTTADNAAMFVWVGDRLSDGTFIQVGTLTRGTYCPTQMALFVQAWDRVGKVNYINYQNYCGQFSIPTYSAFTMYSSGYQGNSNYLWNFNTPEGVVTSRSFPDSDTGLNLPQDVGELSGPTLVNTADSIGPVGANPALAVQFSVGGSYYPTEHAYAYYGGYSSSTGLAGACPPENFVIKTFNSVGFGTGISGACVPYKTSLW